MPERAPASLNVSREARRAKLSRIGDAPCARGVNAREAAGARYSAS